jgi:hypothetical protein
VAGPADAATVVRVEQRSTEAHVNDVVDLAGPPKAALKAQLTTMGVTRKDLLADHAPVAVVPERAVFTLAHRSLSKNFGQGGDRLGTSLHTARMEKREGSVHQASERSTT